MKEGSHARKCVFNSFCAVAMHCTLARVCCSQPSNVYRGVVGRSRLGVQGRGGEKSPRCAGDDVASLLPRNTLACITTAHSLFGKVLHVLADHHSTTANIIYALQHL